MAGGALGVPMLAFQRVLGVPIMIEDALLPFRGRVARFALVTELALVALVHVFLAMALDTFGRQFLDGLHPWWRLETGLVATLALGSLVLPFEGVLGVLVVIEAGLLPSLFVVACLALVAKAAPMTFLVVILAVAGEALGLQLLDV